jgi:hypothetical protein
MTSVAAKLLKEFETLAPEEQVLVRERMITLTESNQQKALERLHGASSGKQLLSKLIEDRAGERARG